MWQLAAAALVAIVLPTAVNAQERESRYEQYGEYADLKRRAEEKARLKEAFSGTDGQYIPYRLLTRDDFRRKESPSESTFMTAIGLVELAAATCTKIIPPARLGLQLDQVSIDDYRVFAPKSLRFRAVMDRECSWWNEMSDLPPDYVLQHEQLHFALNELAVRKLTIDLPPQLELVSDDPQSAAEKLKRLYKELVAQGLAEAKELSNQFDQETSYGVHRPAQAEWVRLVEKELLRTCGSHTECRVRTGNP